MEQGSLSLSSGHATVHPAFITEIEPLWSIPETRVQGKLYLSALGGTLPPVWQIRTPSTTYSTSYHLTHHICPPPPQYNSSHNSHGKECASDGGREERVEWSQWTTRNLAGRGHEQPLTTSTLLPWCGSRETGQEEAKE